MNVINVWKVSNERSINHSFEAFSYFYQWNVTNIVDLLQ